MKPNKSKIFILLLAIIFVVPIFARNNKNNAHTKDNNLSLNTYNDSLNYSFGVMNGDAICKYALSDSLTKQETDEFCNYLALAFKYDKKDRLKFEGYNLGYILSKDLNKKFLFEDSTLLVNKNLFIDIFYKSLKGEKWIMTAEEGTKYFKELLNYMQSEEKVNLCAKSDTINMLIGLINGTGCREKYLKNDTSKRDINLFYKNFIKGLNSDANHEMIGKGINAAIRLNNFIDSKYLFDDPNLPISYNLIKYGIIGTIKQDTNSLISIKEAEKLVTNYFEILQEKINQETLSKGKDFLNENGKKEDIIVTKSGLQYKILEQGKGAKPTATDIVKVHYEGQLIDGTIFDSSIQRGEPVEFPLNQVISGWTEGLQLMPIGSKYIFYIPYQLAYGEQGAGEMIPPYSTLIFKVELIDIIK